MVSGMVAETLCWVGVDWGSSHLRAWALDVRGKVLTRGGSERGMLSLTPDEYENALLKVIDGWLPDTGRREVLVCGMAGSRQGWREAAYLPVPTRLDALARSAVIPPCQDPRLRVRLLPGLCQTTPSHFDVMRGEETQLAGPSVGAAALPGPQAQRGAAG